MRKKKPLNKHLRRGRDARKAARSTGESVPGGDPAEPAAAPELYADFARAEAPVTTWWKLVRDGICYVVLAVVSIALFDLFGLEDTQKLALQDGFNRVMADWYTAVPLRRGWLQRGRSKPKPAAEVAVVLWNEADLAVLGRRWPLQYAEHAIALREIMQAKPRAVFIDVLFKDQRDEDGKPFQKAFQPVREIMQDMALKGIRVYLLNEGGCSDDDGSLAVSLLPSWESEPPKSAFPTMVSAPRYDPLTNGVIREYLLFANTSATDSPANAIKECATAPLRMHLDQRADERVGAEIVAPDQYVRPLVVFWGGCGDSKALSPLRFFAWLIGRDTRREDECFPFEVVRRDDLARKGPDGKPVLQDKLIVYGTNFYAAGDHATTAIHKDRVPGPIVNAMALDNLQRWQTRYVQEPTKATTGPRPLTRVDLVLLALGGAFFPRVRRWECAAKLRRLAKRFAPKPYAAQPRFQRLMVALAATLPVAVLVPIILLVMATPAVFVFSTVPVGALVPHAFAWAFVEEALAVWESFKESL